MVVQTIHIYPEFQNHFNFESQNEFNVLLSHLTLPLPFSQICPQRECIYITARLSKIRVRARFYRKMLASCNEKDARSRDPRITNTRSGGQENGGERSLRRGVSWQREADGRLGGVNRWPMSPHRGQTLCFTAFVITNADWTPRAENRSPN